METDKLYISEYTEEAYSELKKLDKQNQKRVLRTVHFFELYGQAAVKSRRLDDKGLYELKSDRVRIYYMRIKRYIETRKEEKN